MKIWRSLKTLHTREGLISETTDQRGSSLLISDLVSFSLPLERTGEAAEAATPAGSERQSHKTLQNCPSTEEGLGSVASICGAL